MTRRAKRPLNEDAMAKANEKVYEALGERRKLDPNSKADEDFRKLWMDEYVAAGGELEGDPPRPQPPEDPAVPCPLCGKALLIVKVIDEAGNPVVGATVKITGPEERSAITDNTGKVEFKKLLPGLYQVEARMDSFFPDPALVHVTLASCDEQEVPLFLFRTIPSIVIKRKHIDLNADDAYGHWWFEIDGIESYGWWPKGPVGLKETFAGTEGELNGQSNFGGTATTDPHHGDSADEEFIAFVEANNSRTDDQIKQCLRDFATAYSGEWRWTFGAGQNCHTFQTAALEHCGLSQP